MGKYQFLKASNHIWAKSVSWRCALLLQNAKISNMSCSQVSHSEAFNMPSKLANLPKLQKPRSTSLLEKPSVNLSLWTSFVETSFVFLSCPCYPLGNFQKLQVLHDRYWLPFPTHGSPEFWLPNLEKVTMTVINFFFKNLANPWKIGLPLKVKRPEICGHFNSKSSTTDSTI